jgi:hypothetical protein
MIKSINHAKLTTTGAFLGPYKILYRETRYVLVYMCMYVCPSVHPSPLMLPYGFPHKNFIGHQRTVDHYCFLQTVCYTDTAYKGALHFLYPTLMFLHAPIDLSMFA